VALETYNAVAREINKEGDPMFTTSDGRLLLHWSCVLVVALGTGSISFAEEVIKLTRDDGKKLPPGQTRAARELHLNQSVEVALDQPPGTSGLGWVESNESSNLFEVKSKDVKSTKTAPNETSNPNRTGGGAGRKIFTFRLKSDVAKTAASGQQVQFLRLKMVRGSGKSIDGKPTTVFDTWEVPVKVVE
jgi:hypothetical protein